MTDERFRVRRIVRPSTASPSSGAPRSSEAVMSLVSVMLCGTVPIRYGESAARESLSGGESIYDG